MKWGLILGMTVVAALMFLYEWPRMKHLPKKDKITFITLVFIGWFLAMFDLPNIPGPTTLIETIFEPLGKLLEQ